MSTSIETTAAPLPEEMEVARLIVSALSLETRPEDIAPEEPLFGSGLGLDSIDALELALAISKAYGVQLRSDDERNHRIFSSLRALTAHIEKHRAR
jgi:acyl carrier protein